ncbi:exo-beta-N-acetylmuramidase NamZ family protein [Capnocytophaga sp. HP1101]
MAAIAILIIGEEIVPLSPFEKITLFAMKYSTFKTIMSFRSAKVTLFFLCTLISCKNNGQSQPNTSVQNTDKQVKEVVEGANRMYLYIKDLRDKNIAIVTNQTGIVKTEKGIYVHLVDTLLKKKVSISKVFAPEHGFRGEADAGEVVKDGKDTKTGLSIVSLYGKNKKPTAEQLKGVDLVLFDLQDVGVRFYTYISTLHYVMEACAEQRIPVIVLDRPNPNAHYIDGAVLQPAFKSFIGMHPVPIVYGMTIGEYAQMINGEKWLQSGVTADLKVIPLAYYTHQTPYSLPVKPSPNLPNDISVNLYPSLCFFEGTNVSMGRGTDKQFQIYGSPYFEKTTFSFTPRPNEGDKNPKFNGELCYGEDLTKTPRLDKLNLTWLKKAFEQGKGVKTPFFTSSFNKIAGNDILKKQITEGKSEDEIRQSWQKDIEKFKEVRKKYLLYP